MAMLQRLILCVIASLVLSNVTKAVVIDDFSVGSIALSPTSVTGETQIQTPLPEANVLGGTRRVYAGTLASATLEIDANAGRFDFSADSSYGYFELEYGNPTPLNVDLLADGADRFRLSVLDVAIGGAPSVPVFLDIETASGFSSLPLGADLVALNGPGLLDIPFADFFSADFTDVRSVKLRGLRIQQGIELSLGSLTTVPEPGTLGLLMLGAMMISQQLSKQYRRTSRAI